MSVIQVKLVKNTFTPAQKKQDITRLIDAIVSIEGEIMRPFTPVAIEEVRRGKRGIAGQAVTTEELRASIASLFVFGCI